MRCLILIFLTICAMTVHANSLERIGLPNLILLGEGRLTVLFWDIYDARLYVADGSYDPEKPFALSLNYLRGFSGSDITKRSIEEMRKQGLGDESVLVSWPSEGARFFLNDLLIGTITDQNLNRRFFDIWLSEKTSEPEIRRLLMRISR